MIFSRDNKVLIRVLRQKEFWSKKFDQRVSKQKLVSVIIEAVAQEDRSNRHCGSRTQHKKVKRKNGKKHKTRTADDIASVEKLVYRKSRKCTEKEKGGSSTSSSCKTVDKPSCRPMQNCCVVNFIF